MVVPRVLGVVPGGYYSTPRYTPAKDSKAVQFAYPGRPYPISWGTSTNLLQQLCNLPIAYFSSYKHILFPTLIVLCFNNVQNKAVVAKVSGGGFEGEWVPIGVLVAWLVGM